MLPILEVMLGGGTLGGMAYLISKIRCIFLSKNDEPVVVMGASDGSDVIIITAKKEHKIC